MKAALLVLCSSTLLLLAGCSAPSINAYKDNRPLLEPETFFQGRLTAHGVVKNFRGEVIRRFNATIDASWEDGVGTLDETFVFADGERQTRVWTLKPNDDGTYTGTAGDVVGPARIVTAGNAMFLKYTLEIDRGDDTLEVTIDDRMYLVEDGVIINESVMKKWGFKVGEIVLTIVRAPASDA